MTTHETGRQKCPWCQKTLSKAANVDGSSEAPEPGDVSVCLACAMPLMWSAEGAWMAMSMADWRSLGAEHQKTLEQAIAKVRAAPKELREWPNDPSF